MQKRMPGKRLFASVLTVSGISGCASYHPLPLPAHAQLVSRIDDVRHALPAAAGGEPQVIDVDRPLSVDQIGLLAILNDPELQAWHGESDLAQAGLTQSEVLPNPSVSLGYAALLGGPGTTDAFSASLSQDVKSLLTYRWRVVSASEHVSQVNAELLWKEWQVAQKARLLAVDLYWGRLSIERSEAALASVSHAASEVRAVVYKGEMSQSDLAPLLASKAGLEQSISSLRLAQIRNWQELDALLGMTADARFRITQPELPAMPSNLDAQITELPARRPDLIALQLGYRSADADVRAAILGQFPTLVLGGSWGSDTDAIRSGGPIVTFDLPIFDRNQGQVAKTRATRRLLHEQYQTRLDQVDSTIRGLQVRSKQIATSLAVAREEAVSADEQVECAREAYNQGTLDQRAIIDYESTALRTRIGVYDLERGLDETRVALNLELGAGLPRAQLVPLEPESAAGHPDASSREVRP
ncbi:TolC family protein [Paraburkholderia sp. B3]|uniref:TolC family protein n=1 Tax=Paraburkholderia sp. B3 TaxID=3134791 RepID=UPI003981DF63